MGYDEYKSSNSWDIVTRKMNKPKKKPRVIKTQLDNIPTNFIGKEDEWDDINDELNDMFD